MADCAQWRKTTQNDIKTTLFTGLRPGFLFLIRNVKQRTELLMSKEHNRFTLTQMTVQDYQEESN